MFPDKIMQISYPIDTVLPQLKEAVVNNSSVVLHAPPGAGKTTKVPLALLDALPGRIIMLEPRRIAAVSAARWMAKLLNEQPGETVGHTIRFDSKVSARTRIEVVTEGILTRRIQSDPGLENVSLVIFDEFHERSVHADLALALCLDVRKGLRPDLKILVMSATLDYGPIASLLGNAPVVSSGGKAFPVGERYLGGGSGQLPVRMAAAVRTALREENGDILAFLPGAGEIRACCSLLSESLNLHEDRLSLHPLYGDLPFEEQEQAILPSQERRKIVIATNIAETSLTIEGVHIVIDCGLTRRLRFDPSSGMNRLVTVPVSKASAEQRKGRAGRLGPGICYRLYGAQELKGLPAFTPPEILESDLSPLVLELAAWGVKDPSSLSWLDMPSAGAWDSGVRLLYALGAIDDTGSITPSGRKMAALPLHPRLARLLIRAGELNRLPLGIDLAAILSERDPFRKGTGESPGRDLDAAERVGILRRWRAGRDYGENADASALRAVERSVKQLSRLLDAVGADRRDDAGDETSISRLLLAAYPDRVCKRRNEGGGRFIMSHGRGVRISLTNHLVNAPYLIALAVDSGEKTEGFIHLAAATTEEVIRAELAADIEIARTVEWDQQEGRLRSAVEERMGALVLSARSFTPSDDEAAPILCRVIRTTPGILVFDKEARQLQARIRLVRKVFPEESWPDLSDNRLLTNPEDWILPWLREIRTAHALRSLDVLAALKAKLTWEQRRLLDERTPVTLTVPSGSRVRLDYSSEDKPVLAVKLQEMFGLADTPKICDGRVSVLLHLLSPAQRPVQITQDLKGFWNTGYQLVKKDLKGRYPKHPWPDDPWNAPPTRRTKRHTQER